MKRFSILSISATFILLVCISSAWVKLTLVHPSELLLPENIKSIALIDRTIRVDNKKSKTEQILTVEAFRPDEQAVVQLAEGFIQACSGTERFTTVRTAERITSDGTKTTFPTPLDWETVREICDRNNADALFSLEIFDSDFLITPTPVRVETNGSGISPIRLEFKVTGVAVINLGIRLYDAVNHEIIDEYQTTYRMNFDAQAGSAQAAINMLLDKVEATKRAGYEAGFNYGRRITPTYYQVTRYFFNRPKKVLGKGVRYSEVADWKNAIEAWLPVVNNGSRKKAGRAAFNIAVAYEVLGDLTKAREWAARSHTEFEEKDADEYYKMLVNRINEEEAVRLQGKE